MALSDDMRRLAYQFRESYDGRVAAVADIRTSVAAELDELATDRTKLSASSADSSVSIVGLCKRIRRGCAPIPPN